MRRSLPFIFLALAAVAVAGTGLLLFSYSFRRGESFAEGSSYRATPDGLRALALLLERQGHSVSRLTDPWALKGRKGVFILNTPRDETGAALLKPADLRAWVAEGNTAILLCPTPNPHLAELRIRTETLPGQDEIRSTESGVGGRARRLGFVSAWRFVVADSTIPLITLFQAGENPAVLQGEVGLGRLILVSDAHPATNLGLAEHDNALFFVDLAAPALAGGEVIFDETATREDPGVMAYARKSGLLPIFLELGILALLGLWHFASRTAPGVSQRARVAPAVPDYVTGRARLYEKAMMGRTALQAMSETVRDAVHRTPGLAPDVQNRAEHLIKRAQEAGRRRIAKPHELLEVSRSIHDFMNEVIWKPGRRFRRASRTAPLKRR